MIIKQFPRLKDCFIGSFKQKIWFPKSHNIYLKELNGINSIFALVDVRLEGRTSIFKAGKGVRDIAECEENILANVRTSFKGFCHASAITF